MIAVYTKEQKYTCARKL